MIDAVEDARQRRARIEKPRNMIEILFAANAIARREYDAGIYIQSLEHALLCGHDVARGIASVMIEMLRDEVEKIEVDIWSGIVRKVCFEHRRPMTVEGMTRLRQALQAISFKADVVIRALVGADGVA
jgi:hypothetical protein